MCVLCVLMQQQPLLLHIYLHPHFSFFCVFCFRSLFLIFNSAAIAWSCGLWIEMLIIASRRSKVYPGHVYSRVSCWPAHDLHPLRLIAAVDEAAGFNQHISGPTPDHIAAQFEVLHPAEFTTRHVRPPQRFHQRRRHPRIHGANYQAP
jgi:hypothetical protein